MLPVSPLVATMKRYGPDVIIALVLCALTAAAYYQVKDHDWVGFDDAVYVTDNFHVQRGLTSENLRWAWSSVTASNWHPLTMLSHIVDFQLYGLWTGGHSLTNLAWHLANVVLLFVTVQYLVRSGPIVSPATRADEATGDSGEASLRWKAAFVAAMFAIHPLHVESVAWVAERKDVLSTFFFLLALLAYGWYARRPSALRMALVVASMSLGILAKPMLVTLPCVLLLVDFWPLGRFSLDGTRRQAWRLLWEKTPLFVLSLVSSVITYKVQDSTGATRGLTQIALDDRIANALMAYSAYLGHMLWPTQLACYYQHPGKFLLTRPEFLAKSVFAVLILVGITTLAYWLRRRSPYVMMGWLWYLGTLVPVIGLVQVGGQAMADRYTYIPLIGLFIAIAWGVPDLLARVPARRAILATASTAAVVACTYLTWRQVQTWENAVSLWTNVLNVEGENAQAYCAVAASRVADGKLDEAYELCEKAIRLDPDDRFVLHTMASILMRMGKHEDALVYFTQVLQWYPQAHLAWADRAALYVQLARRQEALQDFQRAIQLEPQAGNYHRSLADLLVELKRYPLARDEYLAAIACDARDAHAHASLGNLEARLGRYDQAISHYRRVIELSPSSDDIRANLAALLLESGEREEAAVHYQVLASRQPMVASHRIGLGKIALAQDHKTEAIENFRALIRLEPNVAGHHLLLAAAQMIEPESLDAAAEACQATLAIDSQSTNAHYLLAKIHTRQNDLVAAAEDYEAVLRIEPASLEAANNLAWLLATSDDAELQNAARAIELAERICHETQQNDFSYLDTLAVAYAQAGRFDDALRTAKRAMELARAAKQDELAEQIGSRLKLYEARKPFREA